MIFAAFLVLFRVKRRSGCQARHIQAPPLLFEYWLSTVIRKNGPKSRFLHRRLVESLCRESL